MQPSQPIQQPMQPYGAAPPSPTYVRGDGVNRALSVVAVLLAIAALAINVVIPGPTGVAGAPGVKGDTGLTGATGATGPSGTVAVTVVTYSGTTTDSAPTATAVQLRVIGTFTKTSATTGIQVVWNSHVTGTGSLVCNFHIRVDGVASPPGDFGAIIATNGNYYPVSTTNIFTGLAAGLHTVSLWDRGVSATSCTDNPGNYQHFVVVTESQT